LLGTRKFDALSAADLGLVDSLPAEAFNAITRLALRLFDVPVALISIVEEENDRQYFLSHEGLSEPWRTRRQTPLTHSFCQYVKRAAAPLVVEDARIHPLVRTNCAIADLGVIAYLGVPIALPDGTAIGALCVIDSTPRAWSGTDLSHLEDLALCVNDEIKLRGMFHLCELAQKRTQAYNAMRETVALAFIAPDLKASDRFTELLRAACLAFGADCGRIIKVDCESAETVFEYCSNGCTDFKRYTSKTDALTRLVVSECRHVCFKSISNFCAAQFHRIPPSSNGLYAGTPIIVDGALYGVMEFVGETEKPQDWSEEEKSVLSIVSMLAGSHLGLYAEIEMLRKTDAPLRERATAGD